MNYDSVQDCIPLRDRLGNYVHRWIYSMDFISGLVPKAQSRECFIFNVVLSAQSKKATWQIIKHFGKNNVRHKSLVNFIATQFEQIVTVMDISTLVYGYVISYWNTICDKSHDNGGF